MFLLTLASDGSFVESGAPIPVERNRDRPVGADETPRLLVLDGTEAITEDSGNGFEVEHTAVVTVVVTARTFQALGPALHAGYARIMACVLADRTLGGRVMDTREGEWTPVIETRPGSGPTATGALELVFSFWVPVVQAIGPAREAALQWLAVTLADNAPVAVARREYALQVLAQQVGA